MNLIYFEGDLSILIGAHVLSFEGVQYFQHFLNQLFVFFDLLHFSVELLDVQSRGSLIQVHHDGFLRWFPQV